MEVDSRTKGSLLDRLAFDKPSRLASSSTVSTAGTVSSNSFSSHEVSCLELEVVLPRRPKEDSTDLLKKFDFESKRLAGTSTFSNKMNSSAPCMNFDLDDLISGDEEESGKEDNNASMSSASAVERRPQRRGRRASISVLQNPVAAVAEEEAPYAIPLSPTPPERGVQSSPTTPNNTVVSLDADKEQSMTCQVMQDKFVKDKERSMARSKSPSLASRSPEGAHGESRRHKTPTTLKRKKKLIVVRASDLALSGRASVDSSVDSKQVEEALKMLKAENAAKNNTNNDEDDENSPTSENEKQPVRGRVMSETTHQQTTARSSSNGRRRLSSIGGSRHRVQERRRRASSSGPKDSPKSPEARRSRSRGKSPKSPPTPTFQKSLATPIPADDLENWDASDMDDEDDEPTIPIPRPRIRGRKSSSASAAAAAASTAAAAATAAAEQVIDQDGFPVQQQQDQPSQPLPESTPIPHRRGVSRTRSLQEDPKVVPCRKAGILRSRSSDLESLHVTGHSSKNLLSASTSSLPPIETPVLLEKKDTSDIPTTFATTTKSILEIQQTDNVSAKVLETGIITAEQLKLLAAAGFRIIAAND